MSNPISLLIVLLTGIAIGVAGGAYGPILMTYHGNSNQPYAGQHERKISSLSDDDIASLERGEGWGLAKPAELNGYPGPAHVLQFAEKLDLSMEQRKAVQDSFNAMQAKARELGAALIAAEEALDEGFRSGQITQAVLNERLEAAEHVRAALRAIHLNAHLQITPLLTGEQKQQYAALRGYGSGHNGHTGH